MSLLRSMILSTYNSSSIKGIANSGKAMRVMRNLKVTKEISALTLFYSHIYKKEKHF